jgi:hypothetical protein
MSADAIANAWRDLHQLCEEWRKLSDSSDTLTVAELRQRSLEVLVQAAELMADTIALAESHERHMYRVIETVTEETLRIAEFINARPPDDGRVH